MCIQCFQHISWHFQLCHSTNSILYHHFLFLFSVLYVRCFCELWITHLRARARVLLLIVFAFFVSSFPVYEFHSVFFLLPGRWSDIITVVAVFSISFFPSSSFCPVNVFVRPSKSLELWLCSNSSECLWNRKTRWRIKEDEKISTDIKYAFSRINSGFDIRDNSRNAWRWINAR